jgi:hypothetical protein
MMVCGVLGPKSNAHGPNEFLHVPYAKKLTAAVAAWHRVRWWSSCTDWASTLGDTTVWQPK